VGAADLTRWKGAFATNAMADADADGDSDGADFLAWQRQLGSGAATANSALVPEPSAVSLALLQAPMLLAALRSRRRDSLQ
jgi:hypothetical protein